MLQKVVQYRTGEAEEFYVDVDMALISGKGLVVQLGAEFRDNSIREESNQSLLVKQLTFPKQAHS